jgi:YgiT-type zinc finger domain-containing protein
MNTEESVVCEVCGSSHGRIRRVSRAYGKGDDLLLIEAVPVISCPDCGESYLTAETLHQIDRIKKERNQYAVERCVEVASLG